MDGCWKGSVNNETSPDYEVGVSFLWERHLVYHPISLGVASDDKQIFFRKKEVLHLMHKDGSKL